MMRSMPFGRARWYVTIAPSMIPVASPATQCMREPTDCFQWGAMNASCVPGRGSRQESMYMKSPRGPVYRTISIQASFITHWAGVFVSRS